MASLPPAKRACVISTTAGPELQRVKSLAVPPAYTNVWISPIANGHLQATGRDARGRKQYRYHKRFREVRDEAKYHRLLAFGRALPSIRKAVAKDLASAGLPARKVLAAVVSLLDATGIRVGNEEYAAANGSFGLTTLRTHHVRFQGSRVRLQFRGKTGKEHRILLDDARLARIMKHCRDLPGEELFTYVNESGAVTSVGFGRRQPVYQGDCRRRFFREGLPHVDRDRRMHRRAGRARERRLGGEKQRHRGARTRRGTPRKHARHQP